jgi:hypothetical protein
MHCTVGMPLAGASCCTCPCLDCSDYHKLGRLLAVRHALYTWLGTPLARHPLACHSMPGGAVHSLQELSRVTQGTHTSHEGLMVGFLPNAVLCCLPCVTGCTRAAVWQAAHYWLLLPMPSTQLFFFCAAHTVWITRTAVWQAARGAGCNRLSTVACMPLHS